MANTSINMPGGLRGDPENIIPVIEHDVDIMLDMGPLENPMHSTIIDLTGRDPVLVRQGKGVWEG